MLNGSSGETCLFAGMALVSQNACARCLVTCHAENVKSFPVDSGFAVDLCRYTTLAGWFPSDVVCMYVGRSIQPSPFAPFEKNKD